MRGRERMKDTETERREKCTEVKGEKKKKTLEGRETGRERERERIKHFLN